MRSLSLLVCVLVMLITTSSFAEQVDGAVPTAPAVVNVEINGLVCDFCARALEKVFGRRPEVASVDVNLDTKRVTLQLQQGFSIEDATITELINDAGYNAVAIER